MADSSVRVQGPVSVQSDSRHRVAFDLMEKVANYDKIEAASKDRAYWFNLYEQSLSMVNGSSAKSTLQG